MHSAIDPKPQTSGTLWIESEVLLAFRARMGSDFSKKHCQFILVFIFITIF